MWYCVSYCRVDTDWILLFYFMGNVVFKKTPGLTYKRNHCTKDR